MGNQNALAKHKPAAKAMFESQIREKMRNSRGVNADPYEGEDGKY